MPEPTVNERIALKLGWKPPGHKDTLAWLKRSGWTSQVYLDGWLTPDGDKVCAPPLFDNDPAAAMELVKAVKDMTIHNSGTDVEVWVSVDGHVGEATSESLPAAVAAAWLAAMEAKGG